ncbi:MAG: hypothetical protein WBA86_11510 [Nodosilinea sp.]
MKSLDFATVGSKKPGKKYIYREWLTERGNPKPAKASHVGASSALPLDFVGEGAHQNKLKALQDPVERAESWLLTEPWPTRMALRRSPEEMKRKEYTHVVYSQAKTFPRSRASDDDKKLEIRKKFQSLKETWEEETKRMSFASDMILHPAYQKIIAMGQDAVPLMLEDLQTNLSHWFWALYVITGANPVKPEDEGRIAKMAEAWLEWGRNHGYAC